jgi:ABC-type Fe3+-siderophore transport system permease subunit
MALPLVIVLALTAALLLARGSYAAAIVLAVLAIPVLLFALRRMQRERDS